METAVDSSCARWVFAQAETAWADGDYAGSARCCEAILAAFADAPEPGWQALRAQAKARLAVIALRQDDRRRCAALLSEALDAAVAWRERQALAYVLDACAAYLVRRACTADPERAASLLGAAHAVRGAFDESSLDAPETRETLRKVLGPVTFRTAYESALDLTYETAVTFARETLALGRY